MKILLEKTTLVLKSFKNLIWLFFLPSLIPQIVLFSHFTVSNTLNLWFLKNQMLKTVLQLQYTN